MKRIAMSVAACLVIAGGIPAVSQTLEVSSLDIKPHNNEAASLSDSANYVVGVNGKRVRMVGPRFYPEKTIELLGRQQALTNEAGRSQMASN